MKSSWDTFPRFTKCNNKVVVRNIPVGTTEADFRQLIETYAANITWLMYFANSLMYKCFL